MTLKPGKILRFRGRNAESECDAAESELRGRCKRVAGTTELLITRPVEFGATAPSFVVLDQPAAASTRQLAHSR